MERLESTREQRATIERLSLQHGNAECLPYRCGGVDGVIVRATFDDGTIVNIDQDGRTNA